MNIKSIQIKNVRGIGNHTVMLDMIPNKPSVLVAPNGSGKSSFAFAFQWLNRVRMKLDADDAYMGNVSNKPSMIIQTSDPEETLLADETKNDIVKKFGICVINNGLKAASQGYSQGHPIGKAYLTVPEIVMIDHIPTNNQLNDDFDSVYSLEGQPTGYYPVINLLLSNYSFVSSLDVNDLKVGKRVYKQVLDFIERTKAYEGTREERHSKIEKDDYAGLIEVPQIAYAVNALKVLTPEENKAKLLLKAVRLVTLYYRKKEEFENRIDYAKYKEADDACRELFSAINTTWKSIKPHKEGSKVSIKIGDAQRISNGERDILVFLAKLYKARTTLNKAHNILIIDEVFDYLDDANLMAAQYYITEMIKQMKKKRKCIFPIILSHLNPDYYNQHYSFKNMKVYYLCPLPHPNASDNMIKLLRKRGELVKKAKQEGKGMEEDISKYMLHYNTDYSQNMTSYIGDCPKEWGDINVFKKYCKNHLDLYLNNGDYDPLAVCVALREIIESKVYGQLGTEELKKSFLKVHGTANKLLVAEENGVDVIELYYLLGNLYNDPMHVDDRHQKSITQTLYSRMENNTIRNIIKAVKEN